LKTRELTTVAEMLNNIELMLSVSNLFEKYEAYLKDMVPHTKQLA
jgi:hypothetical protein